MYDYTNMTLVLLMIGAGVGAIIGALAMYEVCKLDDYLTRRRHEHRQRNLSAYRRTPVSAKVFRR